MLNHELAIEIKNLRLSKSWSQQQLADISGLSLRTIQRIEKDGNCSHESLLTLASIFEVNVESLTKLCSESDSRAIELLNRFLLINFFQGWNSRTIAFVSFLLIFPALYFITANLLYYNLNISFLHNSFQFFYENEIALKMFNFIAPVIFIGGTFMAAYFNLAALLKVDFKKSKNRLVGTITYSTNLANIVILCLAFTLILILFTYVLVENFGKV